MQNSLLLLFQIIGLGVLLSVIVLAAIMSCVRRKHCGKGSDHYNTSLLLENLSLTEEETVVKEVLRERAKQKWTEIFNPRQQELTPRTNPEAAENEVNQFVSCVCRAVVDFLVFAGVSYFAVCACKV